MRKLLQSLLLVLTFSICSCQPQPVLRSTSTALPTSSPTPAPTFLPTFATSPTPTEIAQPTPAHAPACILTKGIPFAFLADNMHILLKGDAGIQILDLNPQQTEEFLPAPATPGLLTTVAALSPRGDRLALALTDNTVQVYQMSDKRLLYTLPGHTQPITELEFSGDGERLYSASHDQWVHVWDRNGKQVGAFQPTGADDFPSEVLGMGLSRDGKILATIPLDGKTKIWDTANFSLLRELGAYGGYDNSDALFSPDGQYLAAITANGLFLWRVSDGAQLLGGNPGINAMALAYSPDGRFLVYWDVQGNNEITFLSPDGSKNLRTLHTDAMPVWSIIFSPDSTMMAAASDTETRIWGVANGELLFIGKPTCP
jgi:WD40 repeat protein